MRYLQILGFLIFICGLFVPVSAFNCAGACSCVPGPREEWELTINQVKVDGVVVVAKVTDISALTAELAWAQACSFWGGDEFRCLDERIQHSIYFRSKTP